MPKHDLRDASGRFRKRGQFKNKFFENTLSRGIAQFEFKMRERFEDIIYKVADEMLDYAKRNAPWEDRTGAAREGLSVEVEAGRGDNLVLSLFHGVDYGVWLEIRWGGRYAIIMPTVETIGPRLLERMKRMMSEIVFYE